MGRFCFVTLSLQILRPDGADSDSDKIIPTNITPPWGDSFSRLICFKHSAPMGRNPIRIK
jgi:hypothetical protein